MLSCFSDIKIIIYDICLSHCNVKKKRGGGYRYNIKVVKKKKFFRPTYPNFFALEAGNRTIFCFGLNFPEPLGLLLAGESVEELELDWI